MFPLFMSPTASVNVTFALAISSFIYYNYVGIHENGIINHLKHLTGPALPIYLIPITILIFGIEVVSNSIRPFTLGIRLFANMFADEQISSQVANLYPPFTQLLVPILLMPLGGFRGLRADAGVYAAVDDLHQRSFARADMSTIHGGEHSHVTGEAITTAHV